VPVFDGFRRAGRIEEQSALAREVEVRERDLRSQVTVEVRGALLDLSSAREQVDAGRERVRLTEQEVTQARDRFAAGVAGNADVISASLSLSAARTSLVEAEAAYQSARVSFARAEGTITSIR
jgi:outer membrane protein